MDHLGGRTIKGYELRERLGTGGFGAVYKAYQSTVGRDVAIKIILPHFANHPDFIRRFETEAQFIAKLEHLHIVPLYDYWRDPDGAYLVMRWLRGGSLRDLLQAGPVTLETAAQILDQIASALAAAHRANVIHRDLKPGNILLDEDRNAYLSDFGIAKDLTAPPLDSEVSGIIGSPDYISPEQARSESVTPATDIYCLGVLLYELLTGQHPFPNVTSIERMFKHLNEPLPKITTLPADKEEEINALIQRATAKNPVLRYADALDVATAFRRAIHTGPVNIVESLTQREQAILRLIIEGRSNKEIAQELFISVVTVKWYITHIYRKLGVRSRVQAIVRARELNLIAPGSEGLTALIDAMPIEEDTSSSLLENPYKGLRAFQSADHADFFGREKLVQKLIKRLGEPGIGARFLVVIGPSGSGKSSLVRAGLIPALWRGELPGSDKWFVVEMMPGSHPLDEMEVALTRIAVRGAANLNEHLRRDERGLLRAASLILPDDTSELVLVIDQFEEVFTMVEDEATRVHFLNLLQTAATDMRSRVRVILTLRADYYDRPLNYPGMGDLVRSHMETVLPLSAEELERAIARPAERVGVKFEEGLVSSIVSEINYQAGALPLLQYALTELFEQRSERRLTQAAYQRIGRTIGALAKRADELYLGLDSEAQALARQMFLRLVTLGEGAEDTRRRTPRSELLALTDDPERIDELIDVYTSYRLLTTDTDPSTRTPTVELAHEAIIREWERLRKWLNESRQEVRLQRQMANAAADWYQGRRDPSFLLRGARLETIELWLARTTLTLTARERAFIDASLEQRQHEAQAESERKAYEVRLERRSVAFLRALVVILALGLIVAVILSTAFLNERNRAEAALVVEHNTRATSEANAERSRELALVNRVQAALSSGDIDGARAFAVAGVIGFPQSSPLYRGLANAAYLPGAIRAYSSAQFQIEDGWRFGAATISLDGQTAIVGGSQGILVAFDWQTGQKIRHWQYTSGSVVEADVTGMAMAQRRPTRFAAGYWDGVIRIFDTDSGAPLRTLSGHHDRIEGLAFTPDDGAIISAGYDAQIIVWDAETGARRRTWEADTAILDLCLSADGGSLVYGGEWGNLVLASMETGDIVQQWAVGAESVNAVALSPDGLHIAAGTSQSRVVIYDVESGDLLTILQTSAAVHALDFTPDGRYLLAADDQGHIHVFDAQSGLTFAVLTGHASDVRGLAVHPDGRWVLTTGDDGSIRIWDLQPGAVSSQFHVPLTISSAALSPDGHYVLVGTGSNESPYDNGLIFLYDAQTGRLIRRFDQRALRQGWAVSTLSFSPDGTRALSGSAIGEAKLWDVATGTLLHDFTQDIALITSAIFSPDGRTLFTADAQGLITLWDVESGVPIRRLTHVHGAKITLRRNAEQIMYADAVGNIGVIDMLTGTDQELLTPDSILFNIAESHSGQWIAVGMANGDVLLWNRELGSPLWKSSESTAEVTDVLFSAEDRFVITSATDGIVRLWDVQRGDLLRELRGGLSEVVSLGMSADGAMLMSAEYSGNITFWRIDSPAELIDWTLNHRFVRALSCTERALYGLAPLCDASDQRPSLTPYAMPTATAVPPTATPTERPFLTATPNVNPEPVLQARPGENHGEIAVGERDIWRIDGLPGERYRIRIEADSPALPGQITPQGPEVGLLDVSVFIVMPLGHIIGVGTDRPDGLPGAVVEEVVLQVAGEHFIYVQSARFATAGAYTMTIERLGD